MSDNFTQVNKDELRGHWMFWLALRHFLPARFLRQLVMIVLEQGTQRRIGLQDLFEEAFGGTTLWDESWIVRPRERAERGEGDRERAYYVSLVRSLVWQNDEENQANTFDASGDVGVAGPALIDAVAHFGVADFNWHLDYLEYQFAPLNEQLQESFKTLLGAFRIAQHDHQISSVEPFWQSIDAQVASTSMAVRAVMTKHVADWCADADKWDLALAGYDRTSHLLSVWEPNGEWVDVASAWKACVIGSRSAALAITQDVLAEAARALDQALHETNLEKDPLCVANLSVDSLVVSSHADVDGLTREDRRPSVVRAPLLLASHGRYEPMNYWLRGKYADATRRFWGLLRRQIALGATVDCRATKVWYARNIIDELSEVVERSLRPEAFQLAARMLLESGNDAIVNRISWPGSLLTQYVDEACVTMLIDHARRHKGSRLDRERVVVELFKMWGREMRAPSNREAILAMWRHIAAVAKDFKAALDHRLDLGRAALKALQELAKKRPEMRSDVASEVEQAICTRLGASNGFWRGAGEACETALEYADAFDSSSMELVITAVVSRLMGINPKVGLWPVTRPALAFLVQEPVKKHARDFPATGKAILEQILRLGLEQESEHTTLFYYLHDFDASLLADADVRKRLHESGIVAHLLTQAREIGSSAVLDAIKALLFAPLISGREGVECALESLARILESAKGDKESLGLAFAYEPLLLLLEYQARIATALPGHEVWLRTTCGELVNRVAGVWREATRRPLILAPFALPPPTRPNPTVIHNWAVTSLRFAEAFGQVDVIDAALREASTSLELAPHIALGHATRAVLRPINADDLAEARTDDPDVFYATLGRRLAQLQRADTAEELCKVLIAQVFRFGPRDIDAAVLLEAARLGLHDHVRASGLHDYSRRLEGNRDRRIALSPLLDLFSVKADSAAN